ncbi:phosphoglycolate phosphatase [Pseudomonas asiatica]|uniref:Phosphoglycolate phosphatase n=1 Tax=Pseudomonas monteilii TaxID=76759 RepID=A0A2N1IN07_9PSED|nr:MULTISPECIES: phosphoglycolate phosphatase [Pseudomonas]PKI19626.1 phosphoglycolate phosphatase [Pseudomonas monteilii]RPD93851.1 phosphoglycolate phosphatase [Pseudomonas monteilii]WDM87364.1 phosphoglycolate phosphatase [Pseudomonas asiatica]
MFTKAKAVFFDLDGTLVDTVPDLAAAVDTAMAELGLPLRGEARVRQWVSDGTEELIRRALINSMDGEVDKDLHRIALAHFYAAYRECICVGSRLYDGVLPGLDALRAQGLPLAVVTNKQADFAVSLLKQIGIEDYFDVVVGGVPTLNKKPAPDALLLAADLLGIDITSCLMVGDSVNDVVSARNAGCPVVCVPYGYNFGRDIREARPDKVIESIAELSSLLPHRSLSLDATQVAK